MPAGPPRARCTRPSIAPRRPMIYRKSKQDIAMMRRAGRILARTHNRIRAAVKPGVTTGELDRLAEASIRDAGCVPTFKGIYGDPSRGIPPFPGTLCVSVNEEVVHGLPGSRALRDGDIISVDCGVTLHEGGRTYVADSAQTIPVGAIDPAVAHLLEVTDASLAAGIAKARVGNRLHDIGAAIEATIAPHGYGIVREYFGHGVGYQLHEDPMVPNYGRAGTGPKIKSGWCLAIEPMVNLGTDKVRTLDDKWTVVTDDGAWSAHFEHTIAITDEGAEILTRRDLPEVQP